MPTIVYPDAYKLKTLLESNEGARKYIASRHPLETAKWLALTHRMGRHCIAAMAVLKLIAYMEANNKKLIDSVESNTWLLESI